MDRNLKSCLDLQMERNISNANSIGVIKNAFHPGIGLFIYRNNHPACRNQIRKWSWQHRGWEFYLMTNPESEFEGVE